VTHRLAFARGVFVICFEVGPLSTGKADSYGERPDVGVAAVEVGTGKVLWEAWRLDELPAGTTKKVTAAVDYLLNNSELRRKAVAGVTTLPDVSVTDVKITNPWPNFKSGSNPQGSQGKDLIYYRHELGVIALDRANNKEKWRALSMRAPFQSLVLEVGELALVQIGSYVPVSIRSAVLGGGRSELKVQNLEPHTLKQRVAAAMLLHHYGDGYLRPELRNIINLLKAEKDDPAAARAATAVERRLAEWPKKRDIQPLPEACVAALLASETGNPLGDFPWTDGYRVVTWCLLQELLYGSPRDGYSRQGYNYAYGGWEEKSVSFSDAAKNKLTDHCRRVIATGPEAEKPFAASVLVSTTVGWSRLTDTERKSLLLSSNPSAWRWAALALVKNDRREQLVDWIRERPADDHLDAVWVLTHNKRAEWSAGERKLLVSAAGANPGGVAVLLGRSKDSVPDALRDPIRKYVERETAAPTVQDGSTQEANYLLAAVQFLDRWNNSDDTPLLLSCLKHPLCQRELRSVGSDGTYYGVYLLRNQARVLLERRGTKVPDGIVYEEKIGPEKK
jgi:hypothetical protein